MNDELTGPDYCWATRAIELREWARPYGRLKALKRAYDSISPRPASRQQLERWISAGDRQVEPGWSRGQRLIRALEIAREQENQE